jgi:hypothetical protein
MQNELFTTWEAARFLAQWLPLRSQKAWYRYLMINPSQYRSQDGYKLNVQVINGERRYRKTTLVAFITSHLSSGEPKPRNQHD